MLFRSQYKKDYKRFRNNPKKVEKLFSILELLRNEQPIPEENRPHLLTGNYAVFQRKAHPVKHQAVQQFCVCGQKFELCAGHKQPWNTIVTELLGFASIEIIEADRR